MSRGLQRAPVRGGLRRIADGARRASRQASRIAAFSEFQEGNQIPFWCGGKAEGSNPPIQSLVRSAPRIEKSTTFRQRMASEPVGM